MKVRRKAVPFSRRVAGWVIILIVAYGSFILILGVMQKKLMYFPDAKPFVPTKWALKEVTLLPVKSADGIELRSWYLKPSKGKLTVAFFQGNAGHLGYRNYKIRPWIEAGYGVLLVGYRGFGNPGTPSEDGFYKDARAALDAVIAKGTDVASLVLYGESLGTGVATQMATEYHAAGLVLESPYTSVPDVGADRYPMVPVRALITDQYNSLGKIKDVHMPLLLLHGNLDRVVPTKFGKQLFDAANEPKQAVFVPGAGHNDVYNQQVQDIVLDFIGKLNADKSSAGKANNH